MLALGDAVIFYEFCSLVVRGLVVNLLLSSCIFDINFCFHFCSQLCSNCLLGWCKRQPCLYCMHVGGRGGGGGGRGGPRGGGGGRGGGGFGGGGGGGSGGESV